MSDVPPGNSTPSSATIAAPLASARTFPLSSLPPNPVQAGPTEPSRTPTPLDTSRLSAPVAAPSTGLNVAPQQGGNFRPLNVKDALTYLDKVKATFADQADVYDKFLEIMKSFKSQGIDTPGVINRVSNLFRGHPSLIQGFNTFLPSGYRIECSVQKHANVGPDGVSVTRIVVTTPMGDKTCTDVPMEPPSRQSLPPNKTDNFQAASTSALPSTSYPPVPKTTPAHPPKPQQQPPQQQNQSPQSDARPAMEFNHAINYVNKIKNRFIHSPDTYKAFLEILQTYQKEGKAISDVYVQVTELFKDAADLLDEFKQFLPDPAAESNQQQPSFPPPAQNPASGTKRIPAEVKEPSSKRVKTNKGQKVDKVPPLPEKVTLEKKTKRPQREATSGNKNKNEGYDTSDSLYSYSPYPGEYPYGVPMPQPLLPPKPTPSLSDKAFFANVKAFIASEQTYIEFLKIINLYTQGISDLSQLVSRAFLFIGKEKLLWDEFKRIVGWNEGVALGEAGGRLVVADGRSFIENVVMSDPENGRTLASIARVRSDGEGAGPSYRRLPDHETLASCSGRDSLCHEVLNDVWVSQPSVGEDGFIGAKRNPYEEALHKTEDERHEYDHHIEANSRTIGFLEPLLTSMSTMTNQQKAEYKLHPDTFGPGKSVYQRVIRKVYGKDIGDEVLEALMENPAAVVPVVLARLKGKDDEWKRSLREWNRVWRESDASNYWKALDYQAASLRGNDKRGLTTKALVVEIETIKREQSSRDGATKPNAFPFQLSYTINEHDVLMDTFKMIFSYLDRMNLSPVDKEKFDSFLKQVLSGLFALNPTEFSQEMNLQNEDESSFVVQDSDGAVVGLDDIPPVIAGSTVGKKGGRKVPTADLRKKVLRNAGGRRSKVNSPVPSSRAGSPGSELNDSMDRVDDDRSEASTGTGMTRNPTTTTLGLEENNNYDLFLTDDDRRRWNFFCNSSLCCMIRMFQVIYSRLSMLLAASGKVVPPTAVDPISARHVPSLTHAVNIVFPPNITPEQTKQLVYQKALSLVESLFDGQLDHTKFEEIIRGIYGVQGYSIYNIDKLLHSFLRMTQNALADSAVEELLELLNADRSHPDRNTPQQQIFYRTQAESCLGPDENLYRIEWVVESRSLSFQLLGKDAINNDDLESTEQRWAAYVDNFVKDERTQGLNVQVPGLFLKRNLRVCDPSKIPSQDNLVVNCLLQCRICIRSYRLFYVANTEDFIYRHRKPVNDPLLQEKRKNRFEKWLSDKFEHCRKLAEEEDTENEMEVDEKTSEEEQEQEQESETDTGEEDDSKEHEENGKDPAIVHSMAVDTPETVASATQVVPVPVSEAPLITDFTNPTSSAEASPTSDITPSFAEGNSNGIPTNGAEPIVQDHSEEKSS